MGNPVTANLIKSRATLWYAPVGEVLPSETTIAYDAAWGGNWTRLGFTNAPVTSLYEDTRHQVKVEEHLAPIREFRIAEDVTIETVLAEYNTDYRGLMTDTTTVATVGGVGQKAFDALTIGGISAITQYIIGFEGLRVDTAGTNQPIRVFFPIATIKQNGAAEWSQKTDSYVNVPIIIRAFADDNNSGRVIIINIVTGPTIP